MSAPPSTPSDAQFTALTDKLRNELELWGLVVCGCRCDISSCTGCDEQILKDTRAAAHRHKSIHARCISKLFVLIWQLYGDGLESLESIGLLQWTCEWLIGVCASAVNDDSCSWIANSAAEPLRSEPTLSLQLCEYLITTGNTSLIVVPWLS